MKLLCFAECVGRPYDKSAEEVGSFDFALKKWCWFYRFRGRMNCVLKAKEVF